VSAQAAHHFSQTSASAPMSSADRVSKARLPAQSVLLWQLPQRCSSTCQCLAASAPGDSAAIEPAGSTRHHAAPATIPADRQFLIQRPALLLSKPPLS
jgi:hypothetical protein